MVARAKRSTSSRSLTCSSFDDESVHPDWALPRIHPTSISSKCLASASTSPSWPTKATERRGVGDLAVAIWFTASFPRQRPGHVPISAYVSKVESRFRLTIRGRNIQLQVDRQEWPFRRSYFEEDRIRQAESSEVPVTGSGRTPNSHFSAVLNKVGKHVKALRSLGFPVVTYQVGCFRQRVGCYKDLTWCSNQLDQAIVVFNVESG